MERFINSINIFIMEIKMGLEDRISFKNALLNLKSQEEWQSYRPCTREDFNSDFYNSQFTFEKEQISGRELVEKYAMTFPSNRDYSPRAQLNRMLTECEIPQFTFSKPEILKGFLLSAKNPAKWKAKGLQSTSEFENTEFQYFGFQMKGKMLAYNVFVELENQQNNTFYSFGDYLQNPNLQRELWKAGSRKFYSKLFEIAGLELKKGKSLLQQDLSPKRLREILLSGMSQEDWGKWKGSVSDFERLQFELEGYEPFSGLSLKNAYLINKGEKVSIKKMFEEAQIPYNPEKQRRLHTKDNFQERTNNLFGDPNSLRKSLLELMSQEEWSEPKQFQEVRLKKINFSGKEFTLHSLMHYYCMHKYNAQQEDVNKRIDWQQQEQISAPSSREVLDEILNIAGIQNRWIATFEDVDLRDPKFIRRIFLNAEYDGKPISTVQFKRLDNKEQRKVRVRESEIGFDKSVHSFMLYFTAYDFWKEHQENTLNDVVQKLKKGKSNKSTLKQVLDFAGL